MFPVLCVTLTKYYFIYVGKPYYITPDHAPGYLCILDHTGLPGKKLK